jgi:hypothetical protein
MFVRLKKLKEFYEARLVRLAGRAIPVLLNPFGMLFSQGVVNLVLELDVRANFARAARRRFIFISDDMGDRQLVATERQADFATPLTR